MYFKINNQSSFAWLSCSRPKQWRCLYSFTQSLPYHMAWSSASSWTVNGPGLLIYWKSSSTSSALCAKGWTPIWRNVKPTYWIRYFRICGGEWSPSPIPPWRSSCYSGSGYRMSTSCLCGCSAHRCNTRGTSYALGLIVSIFRELTASTYIFTAPLFSEYIHPLLMT